jgi:hypothetical protein
MSNDPKATPGTAPGPQDNQARTEPGMQPDKAKINAPKPEVASPGAPPANVKA